jgi:hypothetical protein
MMYTLWLYRFKPGMTESTLSKLRARGPEKVHPGIEPGSGSFLGRIWGHPHFTFGSVFRRNGVAAAQAEAQDIDNLLRNLRILSPNVAAMEVRNLIPRDDKELTELGDDGWHAQVVAPYLEAAKANPEVEYHLNAIGLACLKSSVVPPYMVQAIWREKLGFPQQWLGGVDPRTRIKNSADA